VGKESASEVKEEVAAPQTSVVSVAPGAAPLLPGGPLDTARVLALQRRVGNAAVSSFLARQEAPTADAGTTPAGPVPTDAGTVPAGAGPTPEEEIATFRGQTFAPLPDYHPTSGIGQFDAAFEAATGALTITLKVGFTWVAGAGKGARGFRPEELQWTPEEQTEWRTNYIASASRQWGGAHQFHSTKPGWDAVLVNTTVTVVEDNADPHFIITVAKFPKDAPMVQSSICPPGTHHDGDNCAPNAATAPGGPPAPNGTASFDSNDLRPEAKLDWGNAIVAVPFEASKSDLDAAATGALQPVIDQMKADPATRVTVRGRASTTPPRGSHNAAEAAIANMDMARARSAAVQAALVAGGITADRIQVQNHGDRGAGAAAVWRRVDCQVGKQETQDVGIHETGHMLGLGDEYLNAGEAAGTPPEAGYNTMVQAQTGQPVGKQDDASAMSMGSTVRPHHYSSFLEALKAISSMTEWSL
jgi:outer membrane protein OmpA-like peptidoglycan-associated protein